MVTVLPLNRLGQRDIAAVIDRVTGNKSIPSNVRQDIMSALMAFRYSSRR